MFGLLTSLAVDPTHVYIPTGTRAFYPMLLRSQEDPQSAIASVRIAVEALDRSLVPSLWLRTIEKGPMHLQKSLTQTYAMYAGILAFLALMLACVGIYGVMTYLVNQRVAEIGLRMALGATAMDVLKLIVIEGLRPAFIGIVVGMTGSAALSWTLHTTLTFPGSADFFYGVPFYDLATFLGLAGFFIFIAGIATFMPARTRLKWIP
jgi:predicted lysophospholipase L1 biosynthesis ABC-type transport system permease subunit